ncbi:MAG: LysM peptidoglycan-binding domain-containing protein [Bacteroidia bacterium]
MSDKNTRLTIYAYDDEKYKDGERTFTVMFNPSNYTRKFAITYDDKQASGTTGLPQKIKEIKPGDFQLEFVIDGTGTAAHVEVSNAKAEEIAQDDVEKVDVLTKVDEFRDACILMRSNTHRPPFLRIVWGSLSVDCVLLSCDVKHTLFDKSGKPIRATISATFKEAISDEMRVAKDKKNSPDLTHLRIVQEGDTLPLMTYRIYGDSKYYLQVARANGLKDFRKLKAGQEIFFPPINKSSSKA